MNVQISVNDDLLEKIDKYAKSNFMSRSAFFCMCANQHLQAVEVTSHLRDLTYSVKKIADGQEVDAETLKKLDDFERMASLLNFKI